MDSQPSSFTMPNQSASDNLAIARFPPGNVVYRVLYPGTAHKLGLIDLDPDLPRAPNVYVPRGPYTHDPPFSRHGLRRIPNPLNWDQDRRSFTPRHPSFYPSELRIPTYLYSFETLLFLGFSYDTALQLWNQYVATGGNEGGAFGLPRFVIAYLHSKGVVDGITKYAELKALSGYDPRGTNYAGFWPGVRELEGIDPELPESAHDDADMRRVYGDPEERRLYGGSIVKLHHWAYQMVFYRFAFLTLVTNLFDVVDEDPADWMGFAHPDPFALWGDTVYMMETTAVRSGVFPCN